MMTALYVFIGVLAAALVIYIFNQFAYFVRKIKRTLDENNVTNRVSYASPRTPYNGFYGTCGPNLDGKRLIDIQNELEVLDCKIDQLLEYTDELMIAKKRPE